MEQGYKKRFIDRSRISLRLVQKIGNCYKRFFDGYYYDRFGILDPGCKSFDLPKEDHTSFLDACLERAESISRGRNIRIAWSGGIDTTFILALFRSLDVQVKVIHYLDEKRCEDIASGYYMPAKLWKMVRHKYEYEEIRSRSIPVFDGNTYTGCLADALFFPTQAVKGGWVYRKMNRGNVPMQCIGLDYNEWQIERARKLPNLSLVEWCRLSGNGRLNTSTEEALVDHIKGIPGEILFSEDEIRRVERFAELFGKPIDTNWRIVRLVNFCFAYYRFLCEHPFIDKEQSKSFFDTQKFTDIAWTQYWDDNSFYPPDKSVEVEFIKKVFGTDFGVRKNW